MSQISFRLLRLKINNCRNGELFVLLNVQISILKIVAFFSEAT